MTGVRASRSIASLGVGPARLLPDLRALATRRDFSGSGRMPQEVAAGSSASCAFIDSAMTEFLQAEGTHDHPICMARRGVFESTFVTLLFPREHCGIGK
jgi:hypothetical protein